MQYELRDGRQVCIGFEKEYRKFCLGEKSEILREAKGCKKIETLYTMRDTTGGVFSCNASGILPTSFWLHVGYKPPKICIGTK